MTTDTLGTLFLDGLSSTGEPSTTLNRALFLHTLSVVDVFDRDVAQADYWENMGQLWDEWFELDFRG